MKRATKKVQEQDSVTQPGVAVRGSVISLRTPLLGCQHAVVMSNDIQNAFSEYLMVVPLQRRNSRLLAPFAVDLGRDVGMRDLHSARCDWTSTVLRSQLNEIVRAKIPADALTKLEEALCVALGFSSVGVEKN